MVARGGMPEVIEVEPVVGRQLYIVCEPIGKTLQHAGQCGSAVATLQGDLLGDLNRRRGKIQSIEAKNNATSLYAEVPLAEMFGYATAIRSLSKGRAAYSMEPLAFEQVPSSILATIMETVKPKAPRT